MARARARTSCIVVVQRRLVAQRVFEVLDREPERRVDDPHVMPSDELGDGLHVVLLGIEFRVGRPAVFVQP